MQLIYTDSTGTTIKATLDEGESLANLIGPVVGFVPADPGNADYAVIVAKALPVASSEELLSG